MPLFYQRGMDQSASIEEFACSFLEALSEEMQRHTAQQTASGNHQAPQGHFLLMTLHNKLTAVPRDGVDWAGYRDNVIATTEAYWRYLMASGNPCAQAIKTIFTEVEDLLDQYMPSMHANPSIRSVFNVAKI